MRKDVAVLLAIEAGILASPLILYAYFKDPGFLRREIPINWNLKKPTRPVLPPGGDLNVIGSPQPIGIPPVTIPPPTVQPPPITIPPVVIPPPPKTLVNFDKTWNVHTTGYGSAIIDQANGILTAEMTDSQPVQRKPDGSVNWDLLSYRDEEVQIGWQDYGQQYGPILLPQTFGMDVQILESTPYGPVYSFNGAISTYYRFPAPVTINGITRNSLDVEWVPGLNTDSPGGIPFATKTAFHRQLGDWPGKVNVPQTFVDQMKILDPTRTFTYTAWGPGIGVEGYRGHIKARYSNLVIL